MAVIWTSLSNTQTQTIMSWSYKVLVKQLNKALRHGSIILSSGKRLKNGRKDAVAARQVKHRSMSRRVEIVSTNLLLWTSSGIHQESPLQ
jgi:hypothetical protein